MHHRIAFAIIEKRKVFDMKLFRIFGIGEQKILAKNTRVTATVTMVQRSCLYVIKKTVRLYVNDSNTLYSHFITFRYVVDSVPYTGKRFITPYYRCPRKGETFEVCYDPEKPENYACYAFGPASRPIGW